MALEMRERAMVINGTVEEIVTADHGDTLAETAKRAVFFARRRGQPVALRFAGDWLTVTGTQSPEAVVASFTRLALARARAGLPR